MLQSEATECIESFFKLVNKRDVLRELEIIAETYVDN